MGSTQQFCLKWNNHQANLLAVFDQLLTQQSFVDVTLACDGVSLKAHKLVLSACSPFFQSLFADNPCKHPIVVLKDVRFVDLKAIVQFMYRGEVNVSQEQLPALLRTAETLKVKGLAEVTGDCGTTTTSANATATPLTNNVGMGAASGLDPLCRKRPRLRPEGVTTPPPARPVLNDSSSSPSQNGLMLMLAQQQQLKLKEAAAAAAIASSQPSALPAAVTPSPVGATAAVADNDDSSLSGDTPSSLLQQRLTPANSTPPRASANGPTGGETHNDDTHAGDTDDDTQGGVNEHHSGGEEGGEMEEDEDDEGEFVPTQLLEQTMTTAEKDGDTNATPSESSQDVKPVVGLDGSISSSPGAADNGALVPQQASHDGRKRENHSEKVVDFLSKYNLYMQQLHSNKPKKVVHTSDTVCPICHKHYSTKHSMRRHMIMHKPISQRFECSICQKMFNWPGNLRTHLQTIHQMTPDRFDYKALRFPDYPPESRPLVEVKADISRD